MATIKSYSDLQQSKKLVEILPIESADYHYITQGEKSYFYPYSLSSDAIKDYDEEIKYIPCWSLAALISIIPQEIFNGEYIINITEGCDNRWVLTYDHYENRNNSYYSLSTGADNLVDACYEFILKLNELNLL